MSAFATIVALLFIQEGSKSALQADPSGWTDLFPDKDLKGWKRVGADPKVAKKVWGLSDDGKLLQCDGRDGVKELLLNEKEYGDGIFHVEWRWGKDQGEKPNYNGGIFVRTAEDGKIWVQAQVARQQPKPPVVGDLFGMVPVDGKPQRVDILQKGASREAPVGDWNTYEITCKGKKVTLWVNGAVTSTWDDCPVAKGHVALQAEFAFYEFRALKFKPQD